VRNPKFFNMTVIWNGGFTHHIPVADYNLKSQIKFQESLSPWVKSFSYEEIAYKDYYKMIWGEFPAPPKKTRRKKLLDINSN
jgi:hypothetical protein